MNNLITLRYTCFWFPMDLSASDLIWYLCQPEPIGRCTVITATPHIRFIQVPLFKNPEIHEIQKSEAWCLK